MPECDTSERGSQVDVVLIDGHVMVAQSLARVLGELDLVRDASAVAAGESALEQVRTTRPDVVVVDADLRDADGATMARRIAELAPESAVIVLAAGAGSDIVQDAVDAGCRGFVDKADDLATFVDAVTTVARGDLYFTGDALRALVRRRAGRTSAAPAISDREREVLQLVADGADVAEIASRLDLSVHTVRNHLRRAMDHLGVHSRLDAVVEAGRAGLIDLGVPR